MKVYVAQRHYDYQGFEIIGIFTEMAAAQLCCDNDCDPIENDLPPEWREKRGDSYTVQEHELQCCYSGQTTEV